MSETKISWTDTTWNPVRGCSRVSEGCRNCYAERMAARFSDPGQPFHGFAKRTAAGARWTGRVRLIPEKLGEPLRWRKPRFVFVNSMSDLWHERIAEPDIHRVYAVMAVANRHVFQVLTKRPARRRRVLNKWDKPLSGRWPWVGLFNVWEGTSVESRDVLDRIEDLRLTPAAVRFLSIEPLLEDLSELNLDGIHWVIVGGESGSGHRPMRREWAENVRDQCQAQGVPFFFKQDSGPRSEMRPDLLGRLWREMPRPSREEVPCLNR